MTHYYSTPVIANIYFQIHYEGRSFCKIFSLLINKLHLYTIINFQLQFSFLHTLGIVIVTF